MQTWPKAAHICAKVVHILRFLVGPASSAGVGSHLRGIVPLGQDDGFALRVPLPLLANQLFPSHPCELSQARAHDVKLSEDIVDHRDPRCGLGGWWVCLLLCRSLICRLLDQPSP